MSIDLIIVTVIFLSVGIYILIRYIEEKKKYKINYVPMLLSYLEKYQQEKEEFEERAESFKNKLKQSEENLRKIKENIKNYQWKKKDIEKLKQLKGTEFETIFTGILEILGYQITEPYIYKDCNIDNIINLEHRKICIDFIDFKKIKELDENYIKKLVEGKQKYGCKSIWIITNGDLSDNQKKLVLDNDINVLTIEEILKFFPSIRVFDDYFDEKTVYHNYELLYKETYDEIIRRNEWIDEINRKLQKAKPKK
jgi:HJR/Mrr/RecB family endonuclease